MLIIGLGFDTVAVVAFIWPIADMSEIDGKCRIGLPLKVTIRLLSYDAALNFGLTLLFVCLLKPLLSFGGLVTLPVHCPDRVKRLSNRLSNVFESNNVPDNQEYLHPMNTNFLKAVKTLLWKSLIGSVLVSLPTITNISLLFGMKGREQGWLCFVCCTLDGTSDRYPFPPDRSVERLRLLLTMLIVKWAVCVLHWLTVDPVKVDGTTISLLVKPDSASSISSSGAVKPS
jgi:hypothetical protein